MSLAGPLCVEELSAPAAEITSCVRARAAAVRIVGSDRPCDEVVVDCCAVFRQLDMARGARRRDRASADPAPSLTEL
jgi:hypothetical protein